MVTPVMAVDCPDGSINKTANDLTLCNVKKDAAGKDLSNQISNIINWILGIVGIIAVIVMIYGGVQYMTASGDASKVKKAKDIILYGVIGLIIAALAFAIVNFVLGEAFKTGN